MSHSDLIFLVFLLKNLVYVSSELQINISLADYLSLIQVIVARFMGPYWSLLLLWKGRVRLNSATKAVKVKKKTLNTDRARQH